MSKAQVSVEIDGRTYRMACGEGEEKHLLALGERLNERIASLKSEFGDIGDRPLLVMAGIIFADEAQEAQRALREAKKEIESLKANGSDAGRRVMDLQGAHEKTIESVAERIEELARKLSASPAS